MPRYNLKILALMVLNRKWNIFVILLANHADRKIKGSFYYTFGRKYTLLGIPDRC